MNAPEILDLAKSRGVAVTVVNGELHAKRMGGAVPPDVFDLLIQHRDLVTAYICAQELEERWGKCPPPEVPPPMRAAKPVLTERHRRLGLAYVLRQPRREALSDAGFPLEWVWARTEEYRAWAKGGWRDNEIADAALLDFLCWQRRTSDAAAILWLESMEDAWADLRKLEPTREGAITER